MPGVGRDPLHLSDPSPRHSERTPRALRFFSVFSGSLSWRCFSQTSAWLWVTIWSKIVITNNIFEKTFHFLSCWIENNKKKENLCFRILSKKTTTRRGSISKAQATRRFSSALWSNFMRHKVPRKFIRKVSSNFHTTTRMSCCRAVYSKVGTKRSSKLHLLACQGDRARW